jgi:serine/threonine protein kinase
VLKENYVVGKALGFGGFGVTYIGWDNNAECKVAIKEYLPSEFATREPGQARVSVYTDEKKQKQFHDGMLTFLEEAEKIKRFQAEEGIVAIFDSFNENSTAYIVMEYLEGETLDRRLNREGRIQPQEAVNLMLPIIRGLKTAHQNGIIHRAVAPENIFLTRDGRAKLIDFAASRDATTSHSRSLTVVVKSGFSAEEQYRSRGDQGGHTDVFSLGATLYKMITGVTPPDALERRAALERDKKVLLKPLE